MALTWTTPAGSIGTYTETRNMSYQFAAMDSAGGALMYTLSSGRLPGGLQLDRLSGKLSGTVFIYEDTPTTFTFSIRASLLSDPTVQSDQSFTMAVIPWAKWITKPGLLGEVNAYDNVSIQLNAQVPPGGQVAYSTFNIVAGTSLPTGLTITSSGLIHGNPLAADVITMSDFSVELKSYTFNGVLLSTQVRSFSIAVSMWAMPPINGNRASVLGPFSSNQLVHPVQFIASPGLDSNIIYTLLSNTSSLKLEPVTTTLNGVSGIKAVNLVGLTEVVSEDTEYSFTLRVTKLSSSNVTVTDDRRFYFKVLAKTQPQWVTPPKSIGVYSEGSSINYVFTAQSPVRGDTVAYSLLNGSYPTGNLTLLPTANNTATLTGTLGQVGVDTTSVFTLRASEKNGNTVIGISDRTFDMKVTGPTPPTFATVPGMLGDVTDLPYAIQPALPINYISVNTNGHVVVSTAPYNLNNYGIANNIGIYLAGITDTKYKALLDKKFFYVGNADSSISQFELYNNAGPNSMPSNPVITTVIDKAYTAGSISRVANDSVYFSTQISANLNDPDVVATFDIVGGQLPDGLEIDTTGHISGYPTNVRVTKDSANANVYWGAVDAYGNPTIKLDEFTVRVSTVSGNTTANYSIGIINQDIAWSIKQGIDGTNYTFPGRLPALLNSKPLTQVISNTDPYYSYYTPTSNIGRYTQDNQLIYKMIGHNFNATEQQGSEYGLTYEITGLSAGVPDGANAFIVGGLISPTTAGVASNGWINGVLGNIGTDINTYKFNVTVKSANLVGQVNTTATFSNYSSTVLVANTYGLHTGRQIAFTGNTVVNISEGSKYYVKSVANTVSQLANIASGTGVYIDTTAGLAVGDTVTFTGLPTGNISNNKTATVATISQGSNITANFTVGVANIIVDSLANLRFDMPVTFAQPPLPLSNTVTYYVNSLSDTISGTASTNTTDSNISVSSVQGLTANANITVAEFTLNTASKTAIQTYTGTTTFYASSAPSNVTTLSLSGDWVRLNDTGRVVVGQLVTFSGNANVLLLANISNVANAYKVSNVFIDAFTNTANLQILRQRARLVQLTFANGLANTINTASGTMKVDFISNNQNKISNANYTIASVDATANVITIGANAAEIANGNIITPNVAATMKFTTANVLNITVTSTPSDTQTIKVASTVDTTLTTTNPLITLTGVTPNANGTMTMSYSANNITLGNTATGNAIIANVTGNIANATANLALTTEDSPPLVAGPYEYTFVIAGTLNTGIGWGSSDGNLGTITTGSTSRLSIDATFGSDSIETTATITANNANIAVVSAKSLAQYQPVTFSGNTTGNISNVATYYIKSDVTDTSTALTISRTLSGNIVTPNVSGTMTLRSTISDGRFKLLNGELPAGLKLLSTGEIVGRVAFQPTETYQVANTSTTYNFTVRAYSKKYAEVTKDKEYSITTVQKYVQPYDNLYVSALVREEQRTEIDNLLTHISGTQNNSVTKNIYRPGDSNFGIAKSVKYGHMYGVTSKGAGQFYDAYSAAITKNHYYKNLTLGNLKTAVARDATGAIVYEVVYSEIQDNLVNGNGVSVTKEIVQASRVLYPNSLINMRQQIEDTIGRINNSDVLPLWMVTQQTDGNVLGYVPCWVLCYTKPGKSATVLDSVNTYLTDNSFALNQVSFDMDRFTVDRGLTYTYGATNGLWPNITATFTSGNSAIVVNNVVGLVPNQAVKFIGTVDGVNTSSTYWISNVHTATRTVWVRNQYDGNITTTALVPKANGTMTLSTVPKSVAVADDSRDTYVIFTGNNILG